MSKLADQLGGQSALASRLGKDRNQVYQWLLPPENSAHRGISDATARMIERACGLPNGSLDHDQVLDRPAFSYGDRSATPVSLREETVNYPHSAIKRVPVRGTASMGLDGFWVDLEYPQGMGDGYFEHPTTDPDAYVLRVKGDSMFPAIRSGWYVLVEPNGEIHQGEYVLVKLVDGRSTVKELLWHRNGEYSLLAIASGDRLTVSEEEVADIHPIAAVLPPSKRRV